MNIKDIFLFRGIDKKRLIFLVKFLTLSIYADKNINELEIVMAKNVIKEFLFKNYDKISETRKEKLYIYLVEKLLNELKKIKNNPNYLKELEEECLADFQNEKDKVFFIEKMFDIFWSDNTLLDEEKEMFERFNKFVEDIQKGDEI